MHTDDNCVDGIVFAIAVEDAFDPLHLCRLKVAAGGVIEINEIDAVAHPVKVGPGLCGLGVIFQPLLSKLWPVEIFVKLLHEMPHGFSAA